MDANEPFHLPVAATRVARTKPPGVLAVQAGLIPDRSARSGLGDRRGGSVRALSSKADPPFSVAPSITLTLTCWASFRKSGLVDTLVGDLRDMQQAVAPRKDLDDRAEIEQAKHGPS